MKSNKKVKIADLKANLSKHLRDVKSGESITVVDRDAPIALLVPLDHSSSELISIRPPTSNPKLLSKFNSSLKKQTRFNSTEILNELRGDKSER